MSNMLETAFDVPNEEGTKFDLIPADKYKAEIVKAFAAPFKNGKGQAINLHWSITDGEYDKRLVFQTLALEHESEDYQRFSRQRLKDICVAIGHNESLSDLNVLLYRPAIIQVKIRKGEGGFEDKNEVGRVTPVVTSWNGSKPALSKVSSVASALKEATTVPKVEAVDAKMDDDVPF
jgi:Protein of unknown function (DUF669)